MDDFYVASAILAMAAVTFALRAAPFALPVRVLRHPLVRRAAQFIPLVIMTILVAHAFDGATLGWSGTAWPIAASILVVAGLHIALSRPLVSILGGVLFHVGLLAMI